MNTTGRVSGTSPLLLVALAVGFLLELALLAGVATLAWQLASDWWRWPAAVVAVVAVAALWGLLLSPKASIKLPAAKSSALSRAPSQPNSR